MTVWNSTWKPSWLHEYVAKLTLHLILNTICASMIANNSFKTGYATVVIMAKDFLFRTSWTTNKRQEKIADLFNDLVLVSELLAHVALMTHELREQRQAITGNSRDLLFMLVCVICSQACVWFRSFCKIVTVDLSDFEEESQHDPLTQPLGGDEDDIEDRIVFCLLKELGFIIAMLLMLISTCLVLVCMFMNLMNVDGLVCVVAFVKISALMIGNPDDTVGLKALHTLMGQASLATYLSMSLADVQLLTPEDVGRCVEKCPYCACNHGNYIQQMSINVCNSTDLELYSQSLPSYQNFSVVNRSNPAVQAALWPEGIVTKAVDGATWTASEGRCFTPVLFDNAALPIFAIFVVVIVITMVMSVSSTSVVWGIPNSHNSPNHFPN
jgi:hypothetical protein